MIRRVALVRPFLAEGSALPQVPAGQAADFDNIFASSTGGGSRSGGGKGRKQRDS